MREFSPKQNQPPKGSDGPLAKPPEKGGDKGSGPDVARVGEDGMEPLRDGADSPFRHDFSRVRSHGDGPGRPLDAGVRLPLERFLNHGLDHVRVITGPGSRRAAESLGAVAFTHGENIHLGSRGESLGGSQRKGLLAHEAVHTLQQREARPAVQRSAIEPDAEGSPQERQAEGLARAFVAHERGHSAGLAIRDSIGLRPVASSRVQLARVPTTYGEFEDYKFNDVKDSGGTTIGVQLYLKFHPGTNVDATKIGISQAATGKKGGSQINTGIYGRRQATSGAGAGYFIDMLPGRPSPMYGTEPDATAGADASKIGSYAAPGINAVTQQQLQAAGFNVTGIDYGGGSVFGYRYMDKGALKGPVAAEMHDAPQIPGGPNSSEQTFETAALAFEGNMAGTYFGSVEWGWRRDAKGVFTSVPIAMKSMGVPTVNFLTAANVWNSTKDDFGRLAVTNPTNILKQDLTVDFTVPVGTGMRVLGSATQGANTFFLVAIVDGTGRRGIVNSTDVGPEGEFGRDTLDLPVPEIWTVNVAAGTVLDGETQCRLDDPTLPSGTRVQVLGQYGSLTDYVRVQVADGPLTGRRGVLRRAYLTRETLGTR